MTPVRHRNPAMPCLRTGESMIALADKLQVDQPDPDRRGYIIAGEPNQQHRQASAEVMKRKSYAQQTCRGIGPGME